jgi:predicted PP-loop superfamily ATPase
MLDEGPSLVVAFPGGTGTAHMVRIAREAGVNVLEVKQ